MSSRNDAGAVTGPSRVNVTFYELVAYKKQLEEIRDRNIAWDTKTQREKDLRDIVVMAAKAMIRAIEELLSD